jgi:hypothetical protein
MMRGSLSSRNVVDNLSKTDGNLPVPGRGSAVVGGGATVVIPSAAVTTPATAVDGTHAIAAGAIDWINEPLPPNWERKLLKGTNKVRTSALPFPRVCA